jgi:tetratricopeptide (TPR) repeat protein
VFLVSCVIFTEIIFRLREIISLYPENVRARNALAALSNSTSAKATPPTAEQIMLFNKTVDLFKAKNFMQAIDRVQHFIAAFGPRTEALNLLAASLSSLGDYRKAIEAYEKILIQMPAHPETHIALAFCHERLEEFDKAIKHYIEALELSPASAEAHYKYGALLGRLSRYKSALTHFEYAVALKPNHQSAKKSLGAYLFKIGDLDAAAATQKGILDNYPDDVETLINYGVTMRGLGDFETAFCCYQKAIQISPNNASAHTNLGLLYRDMGQYENALASCRHAVDLEPKKPNPICNLGVALLANGEIEQAIEKYDEILKVLPSNALARFYKSFALLLRGEYKEGFKLYESRFQTENPVKCHYNGDAVLWNGKESLEGKTLLVHAEQGFGDSIMFARFLAQLAKRAKKLIFLSQPELTTLLGGAWPNVEVIRNFNGCEQVDFHCPLMSVPHLINYDRTSQQPTGTYLQVPKIKNKQRYKKIVENEGLKVGLVFSGNPNHKNDRNRSVDAKDLLGYMPEGATYHVLQKAVSEAEQTAIDIFRNVMTHLDLIEDYEDTAVLCSLMDLIVTVDTSVAHLAGTLGSKTLLMLPFVPDWRWGMYSETTHWYPSMRVIRQEANGDWSHVLKTVRQEIEYRLAKHG